MTTELKPDICVIGAGSAGLTVAAAAAAFGVDVVLLEKGRMGGDCLNYGCVPSKALIASAKHAHAIREGAAFGIKAEEPKIDFQRVHDHVHEVIGEIHHNDSVERFTGLGVNVIQEAGRFIDRRTVAAGDCRIKARRFVIATGSGPLVPPIPGLDTVDYLTNETLFDLTRLPKHLVIVGGGPIGIEMAQAFRRLGSEVTVLEAARALGKDDPELAGRVLDSVRADGAVIREGAKVTKVAKFGRSGARVTIETGAGEETVDATHLLVAVGRRANVEGLGLDEAGIAHSPRGITIDKKLRTSNRRVYAAGDITGGFQFTHWAGYHAGLVVRSILFRFGGTVNDDLIPWATYTDPELAHVGLTEEQARERHGDIRILRWPYAENDRAQAERAPVGTVKVIALPKGRIVGAGIVGRNAGELIALWALAISQKLTVKALTETVLPYPTLSETAKRVAVTYYTPKLDSPWLRRLIRFMRLFG
jgi:pyruvate/2-oxoglutarate dehydrogenase complex dihydrolipoamide dehydrogenase (E3) component